jgi:NADH:ubiquinone oxidoreductase subunit E
MNRAALESILERYRRNPEQIIAILHALQDQERYLPEEDLRCLAKELGIPASQLFHISTFYKAFSLKPRGKHVCSVCLGTACYVRGGKRVLEAIKKNLNIDVGQMTPDKMFSLEVARCFGACGLAPTMCIDNDVHKRIRPAKVGDIISSYYGR